mgnify:CR=1 FL=1
MEPLIYLVMVILFIAIIFMRGYKCPKCGKRTKEIKSSRYEDTTPRKKDGTRDKRYKVSGVTWVTVECKNEKCKNVFECLK